MRRTVVVLFLGLLLAGHGWAADGGGVLSEVVLQGSSSWDGRVLPEYAKGRPEITVLRITIPPGAVLPVHVHKVINAGVLVAGELTVVTEEGKTLHLKAGDGIIEVVNTWHYGKNEGERPAEIIVFYAGVVGMPVAATE